VTIAELEKAVVRAALRWHHYRERYTWLRPSSIEGEEPHRMSYDRHWDKLEELEKVRDEAVADLAAARKEARR
jgi:hypothetical protein